MNAIKAARRLIERDPEGDDAKCLSKLVLALESQTSFDLSQLYEMDLKDFELAINIIQEWRLDRYYAGKGKLLDLSVRVQELPRH